MPLYEFRCLKCQELFELLVMAQSDTVETKCPHCGAADFERVMSTASYNMSGGGSGGSPKATTRTCAGGSCTTYDIPGPNG
jgi:putative FmdB family regulatory protein